jgi:hypothetical protein
MTVWPSVWIVTFEAKKIMLPQILTNPNNHPTIALNSFNSSGLPFRRTILNAPLPRLQICFAKLDDDPDLQVINISRLSRNRRRKYEEQYQLRPKKRKKKSKLNFFSWFRVRLELSQFFFPELGNAP